MNFSALSAGSAEVHATGGPSPTRISESSPSASIPASMPLVREEQAALRRRRAPAATRHLRSRSSTAISRRLSGRPRWRADRPTMPAMRRVVSMCEAASGTDPLAPGRRPAGSARSPLRPSSSRRGRADRSAHEREGLRPRSCGPRRRFAAPRVPRSSIASRRCNSGDGTGRRGPRCCQRDRRNQAGNAGAEPLRHHHPGHERRGEHAR